VAVFELIRRHGALASAMLCAFDLLELDGRDLRREPIEERKRPAIARTVTVELQRHSPVAKEASPAKDVSPVVSTAKADTKQIKHYKPKVLARQRNNYGYGNARGYASGYGPSSLFFWGSSEKIKGYGKTFDRPTQGPSSLTCATSKLRDGRLAL
jgi:hypothetical protein